MDNTTTESKQELAIITPKDLVHLNELDIEIAGWKETYGSLEIADENDKEGYEAVRLAIGVIRPRRTGLENERKSVVKPYNDTVSFINGKYAEVTKKMEEVEKPLKAKKEAIDDIIDKQKEEKKQLEEQRVNNRINELIKNGASFDGNFYSIKSDELGIAETSVGIVDIRTMSDDLFKNILQAIADKNAKIVSETERVNAEKKKAEDERLAKEKEEKAEFEKQKKEMDRLQNEMKQAQEKLKAEQELLEKEKEKAKLAAEKALVDSRTAELFAIGMTYNGTEYVYENIRVTYVQVSTLTDELWSALVAQVTPVVERAKHEAEEKSKKELAAKLLLAEETKKKEEEDRIASMNDAGKLKNYITLLQSVPVPEMKTKKNVEIVNKIADFIRSLNK